ncbi:PREDICTED: rhomboid-related protein 4-like [Dufourea novaeangliae]|uniref:Rhomboid domain-containing protein 1 n=1 Tax=Dufourea novaeangliae TaxID=178035 RepID=A0A154P2B9_DUFNO|nr:PREDICTED: rhomboid-related protein 4-like [Dufourea novaeangliae]KZC05983.1 Rhomboid domain-containing protein 1 [Dufourea novaeangliae]
MRPVQRRQQGFQYGIYLLCMQALNFGIDKIPPATLAAIIGQVLLYIGVLKVPWNAEEVCISALKVFKHHNWKSFVVSSFEHGSDMHLYYNMVSLILKGSYLEPMYGTMNFTFLLGILTLGCSAMYAFLAYALTQLTGDYSYYTQCAIGFSAVLFALKVIVICEEQDRIHDVGGFRVPSKIAVWVELILIHLLVPQSSLIGHLGGILVGCSYCYTFIGVMIDNIVYTLTGTPIIHEEQFYRRRNSFLT